MICTRLLLPLLLPLPRVPPPRLRAVGTPLESFEPRVEPLEPRASYFSGPAEEEIYLARLQRRVEELERLLPGLDVPALLQREPDLVDNPHVLARVVALQEALPRAPIGTLVRRAPGLLLVKDVSGNLAALQALRTLSLTLGLTLGLALTLTLTLTFHPHPSTYACRRCCRAPTWPSCSRPRPRCCCARPRA